MALKKYRYMEIGVFISQVFSIFLYVAQCKLFIYAKKGIGGDDPFWYLLTQNQSDFLAKENQIMICTTLQITNYMIEIIATIYIFENRSNDFYAQIGINLVQYTIWCVFVWQGTKYHELFSSCKLTIFFLIGFVDVAFAVYQVVK